MHLPTVRVKHPDPAIGTMIINESDFDPEIHERVEEDSEEDSSERGSGRRRRVDKPNAAN